jgi:CRP/FNR family cyclic AMP-dependent transcriptional regulator
MRNGNGHDEKLDAIRALPPFLGASRREVRDIAAVSDLASVKAGRVLCRADNRALEVYVVVDGTVDVHIDGEVVASLGRGEIVGELAVIDGEARTADVVAATDVTVLAVHAQAFRGLLETSYMVRLATLRQMAERVRRMDLVDA